MIAVKTVVLGASSLAGHETVVRLRARRIAAGEVVLVDPGSEAATISQADGELVVATPRVDEALDGASVILACTRLGGDEARLVRDAAGRGAVVLDLAGSLEARVFDPWGSATIASLGAGLHGVPAASANLAFVLARAARAGGAKGLIVATCFEPASELGRAALDEMIEQGVAMLNFAEMPTAVLGRQAVHDVHSPGPAGLPAEQRIRREVAMLLDEPAPSLVVVRPGLFHGVAIAMRAEIEPARWKAALAETGRLEMADDDADASPASAAREERAILGRVAADDSGGSWAWAVADSLTFGAVGGALEVLARSPGAAR